MQALGIWRYVIADPMYPNHFRGFRIGRVKINGIMPQERLGPRSVAGP